jgi:hypothetical protein
VVRKQFRFERQPRYILQQFSPKVIKSYQVHLEELIMLLSLLLSAVMLPEVGQASSGTVTSPASKVRIGTYDNRSVAVAYAASKHNPVKDKWAAYEKAKTADDKAKIKELQAWGEEHQKLLHFQGFGRVPVSDLLEPVKDQVRDLATKKGLAAITMSCDFVGAYVEIVDVTEDLVKLYEPSERTLKMARGVRNAKPVGLVELSKLPVKD